MDYVGVVWNWLGDNSAQLQLILAVIALVVAFIALFKVLRQIEISNNQTQISLNQMDSLNKERLFEVTLRMQSLIWEMDEKLKKITHDFIRVQSYLEICAKDKDTRLDVDRELRAIKEYLDKISQTQQTVSEYNIKYLRETKSISVLESDFKELFGLNRIYMHYQRVLRIKQTLVDHGFC